MIHHNLDVFDLTKTSLNPFCPFVIFLSRFFVIFVSLIKFASVYLQNFVTILKNIERGKGKT